MRRCKDNAPALASLRSARHDDNDADEQRQSDVAKGPVSTYGSGVSVRDTPMSKETAGEFEMS